MNAVQPDTGMNEEIPPGSVGRWIEKSVDRLGLVERYLAGFLMIAMTGLYAFNVFVRVVIPTYGSSFAWISEASRYAMIWIVFLAAGIALEIGRHVTVDIMQKYFSPKFLTAVFLIIDVVGLVFSLSIAYFSAKLVLFVAGTGQISPTLGIPTYVLYVAPCVGFFLLALRYFLRICSLSDARRTVRERHWLGDEHA